MSVRQLAWFSFAGIVASLVIMIYAAGGSDYPGQNLPGLIVGVGVLLQSISLLVRPTRDRLANVLVVVSILLAVTGIALLFGVRE
jgi:uncharacterized membrane protein YhaH (DUF805 family)